MVRFCSVLVSSLAAFHLPSVNRKSNEMRKKEKLVLLGNEQPLQAEIEKRKPKTENQLALR